MLALGGTTNIESFNEGSDLLVLLRLTCGGAPPHSPQLTGADDHVGYVMPARAVVDGCPDASSVVDVRLQQHRLDDAALLQCAAPRQHCLDYQVLCTSIQVAQGRRVGRSPQRPCAQWPGAARAPCWSRAGRTPQAPATREGTAAQESWSGALAPPQTGSNVVNSLTGATASPAPANSRPWRSSRGRTTWKQVIHTA